MRLSEAQCASPVSVMDTRMFMRIAPVNKSCALLLLPLLLTGCSLKQVLREQKLADCATNTVYFKLTWPAGQLFQIVLGVPYSETNALAFRGEMVFRQGAEIIARVPVSSEDVKPCNWLDSQKDAPHVAGLILTWQRKNETERFDRLLAKGRTYDVEATFSNSPPQSSSLWLCWVAR
jgi:hypothetical protein